MNFISKNYGILPPIFDEKIDKKIACSMYCGLYREFRDVDKCESTKYITDVIKN